MRHVDLLIEDTRQRGQTLRNQLGAPAGPDNGNVDVGAYDEIEGVAENVQTDGRDDVDALPIGEAALAEALDVRMRHLAGSPHDARRELQRPGRLVVFRAPGSGRSQLESM
jgi:hypothetical protein